MAEPCGHFDQQLITNVVAQGVVDVLEVVQVYENQCSHGILALCLCNGQVQPVLEQGTVGQASQGIVSGQVFRLFLALLKLGDVREHGNKVVAVTALVYPVDGQPLREDLAVLTAIGDLPLPEAVLLQRMPHFCVQGFRGFAGLHQVADFPADGFLLGVPGDAGKRLVNGCDNRIPVGDHNSFARVFEDLGGYLELLRGGLPFGDVFRLVDDQVRVAVFVPEYLVYSLENLVRRARQGMFCHDDLSGAHGFKVIGPAGPGKGFRKQLEVVLALYFRIPKTIGLDKGRVGVLVFAGKILGGQVHDGVFHQRIQLYPVLPELRLGFANLGHIHQRGHQQLRMAA